jgi:hypothetical protein
VDWFQGACRVAVIDGLGHGVLAAAAAAGQFAAKWLLLIHTDGVRARFKVEDLPAELHTNPQQLADAILGGWSRDIDDATIVVIRPAG